MRHSALLLLAMVCDYALDSFALAGTPRYLFSRVGTRYPSIRMGTRYSLSRFGIRYPFIRVGTRYSVGRLGTRFAVSLVTTPLFYKVMMHYYILLPISFDFSVNTYFVLTKIFQSAIHHRQRKLRTSVAPTHWDDKKSKYAAFDK